MQTSSSKIINMIKKGTIILCNIIIETKTTVGVVYQLYFWFLTITTVLSASRYLSLTEFVASAVPTFFIEM